MKGQLAAIDKFGFQNVYTEYAEDYDKKWLQDRKAKLDEANFVPNLLTKSGMTQIKNPGGNTIIDITSYMEQQDVAIDSGLKDLNKLLGGAEYTFEEIMAGKDAAGNDIVLPEGMSENIFTDRKDQLRNLAGEKAIQERLLREARNVVGPGAGQQFLQSVISDGVSGQDVLSIGRS